MELAQDKYDLLNSRLLILHKEILTLEKHQIEELNDYVNQLAELIGIYDQNIGNRLNDLKMKVEAFISSDVKYASMSSLKNEALAILSKFFFELKPEE